VAARELQVGQKLQVYELRRGRCRQAEGARAVLTWVSEGGRPACVCAGLAHSPHQSASKQGSGRHTEEAAPSPPLQLEGRALAVHAPGGLHANGGTIPPHVQRRGPPLVAPPRRLQMQCITGVTGVCEVSAASLRVHIAAAVALPALCTAQCTPPRCSAAELQRQLITAWQRESGAKCPPVLPVPPHAPPAAGAAPPCPSRQPGP
jgi:hypothetical protein